MLYMTTIHVYISEYVKKPFAVDNSIFPLKCMGFVTFKQIIEFNEIFRVFV